MLLPALASLQLLGAIDSVPQSLTEPASPKHKVVAVLLSGAMRTLDWCAKDMHKQLVAANPEATFEFFAHLTADDDVDRVATQQSVEASLRNVSGNEPKVRVVTESEVLAMVEQSLPMMEKAPMGKGTAKGKAPNIIQMFHGIAGAASLMYESIDSALMWQPQNCSNPIEVPEAIALKLSKYDLIMRIRPDLCLCGPLQLDEVQHLLPQPAQPNPHLTPRFCQMAGSCKC